MSIDIPRGFLEQLAQDPDVKRILTEKAEEAKGRAEMVARGFSASGSYARRFVVNDQSLGNTDPAAHLIEWGSVNNRPYAPLRKAVEETGARWVDNGG